MNITFDEISIHQMSGNTGVFVGSNVQMNWRSQTKTNSALGTVLGEGIVLTHNMNVVYDNDQVDMPIWNDSGNGQQNNGQGKSGQESNIQENNEQEKDEGYVHTAKKDGKQQQGEEQQIS